MVTLVASSSPQPRALLPPDSASSCWFLCSSQELSRQDAPGALYPFLTFPMNFTINLTPQYQPPCPALPSPIVLVCKGLCLLSLLPPDATWTPCSIHHTQHCLLAISSLKLLAFYSPSSLPPHLYRLLSSIA